MTEQKLCSIDRQTADSLQRRAQEASNLAVFFKVLADDTRIKIAYLLSLHSLCVHDIATLLGISQPNASHHLRVLRQARLVRYRRQGKNIFYRLDDHHVETIIAKARLHADHIKEETE